MPRMDPNIELLHLINRSPCGMECAPYLNSEGIGRGVIAAAVRAKQVTKVAPHTYSLTSVGHAVLANYRNRRAVAQKPDNR